MHGNILGRYVTNPNLDILCLGYFTIIRCGHKVTIVQDIISWNPIVATNLAFGIHPLHKPNTTTLLVYTPPNPYGLTCVQVAANIAKVFGLGIVGMRSLYLHIWNTIIPYTRIPPATA